MRVLSATNADLAAEVAAGRFRQDLLFRLNTVEIPVPPLRERARGHRRPGGRVPRAPRPPLPASRPRGFTDAALAALLAYSWPGNVRELDHAVERGVLMARGDRIDAADLGVAAHTSADRGARLEDLPLEEVERVLIRKALTRFDGNVTQAARFLGLSRSALYRRLEKLEA